MTLVLKLNQHGVKGRAKTTNTVYVKFCHAREEAVRRP
jgi:hypothetical protein